MWKAHKGEVSNKLDRHNIRLPSEELLEDGKLGVFLWNEKMSSLHLIFINRKMCSRGLCLEVSVKMGRLSCCRGGLHLSPAARILQEVVSGSRDRSIGPVAMQGPMFLHRKTRKKKYLCRNVVGTKKYWVKK